MKDERGVSAGRDITGSQIVTGVSGGSVEQRMTTEAASPELADLLDRLERLLDAHAERLEEGAEARGDVADVRAQAEAAKPDERRLADTLKRLTERVASVGALVAAVKKVADALGVPLP
jgi:hypothetical protein